MLLGISVLHDNVVCADKIKNPLPLAHDFQISSEGYATLYVETTAIAKLLAFVINSVNYQFGGSTNLIKTRRLGDYVRRSTH